MVVEEEGYDRDKSLVGLQRGIGGMNGIAALGAGGMGGNVLCYLWQKIATADGVARRAARARGAGELQLGLRHCLQEDSGRMY